MKKRIIIFILVLALCLNYVYGLGYYIDVDNHWSSSYVYWATHEVKAFRTDSGNLFKPDERMTRGEYIYLLDRVLQQQNMYKNKKKIDLTHYYTDLNENYWGYDSIVSLVNYINNFTSNGFNFYDIFPSTRLNPNLPITRYEAALLARAVTTPPIFDGEGLIYSDLSSTIKYYSAIMELINNGIMKGYSDGTFKLYNRVTRGEAAVIAKKVHDDLSYLQKDYLNFYPIESLRVKDTLPLFETESNGTRHTLQDRKFINAITSLEYLSFIGYIPYEERHLYDTNPIDTLWDLKNEEYYNVIGVNYYLLKGDKNLVMERKKELVNEALQHYMTIENKNIEGIYSFLKLAEGNIAKEYYIEILKNKFSETKDIRDKKAAAILLSEVYVAEERYHDAMVVYQLLLAEEEIRLRIDFLSNYLYLLLETKGYDAAMEHLKSTWSDIRFDRQYLYYKSEIDEIFTAIMKQLKINKI